MVDLSKYAGSRFIKLADVANGPKRKIIADIVEGDFDKLVAVFSDGSRMSLNKTNINTLIDLFGSPDSKYTVGKLVEVFAGTTTYQNTERQSVLLRGVPDLVDDDLFESTKAAPEDHPAVAAPFTDDEAEYLK
jgi:hypothetical protein